MGMLWLDVERFNWPKDKAYNRRFIRDMANKAKVQNAGVLTTQNCRNHRQPVLEYLFWMECIRLNPSLLYYVIPKIPGLGDYGRAVQTNKFQIQSMAPSMKP